MHRQPLSYRSLSSVGFIFRYIGWWHIWAVLQFLALRYTANISWELAVKDALLTNMILGLAGYEMIMIMRHFQPRQSLRLIWSIGLTIICVVVMKWLMELWVADNPEYITFFNQWIFIRALFAWLMISFITVLSWMYFFMQEQQEQQVRQVDAEKLSKEAELATLRQQLQPHFLFNSLNSISALAGARPEEARKMIQQLSDFLRGTIRRDNQQLVTFEEELKLLQLYLEIEKVRFGHRLRTHVEKEDATLVMTIPSLLLQPIVENAIKFGLYDTTGDITIAINAKQVKGFLSLTVTNPFDPSTAAPKQGTGFGLSSVQRRLYLLYGRNDLLTTQMNEHTFTSTVLIPQG